MKRSTHRPLRTHYTDHWVLKAQEETGKGKLLRPELGHGTCEKAGPFIFAQ